MVSMQFFGLRPVLNVPYNHMLPNNLYWHLIALGILLGILGRFYQIVILHLNVGQHGFLNFPRSPTQLFRFCWLFPLPGIFQSHWAEEMN